MHYHYDHTAQSPYCGRPVLTAPRPSSAVRHRPVQGLTEIEALLRDAEKVPASLPNVETLQEAVKKAQDWMERVVAISEKKEHPRLEVRPAENPGRPRGGTIQSARSEALELVLINRGAPGEVIDYNLSRRVVIVQVNYNL